jgi:hypothetical protein
MSRIHTHFAFRLFVVVFLLALASLACSLTSKSEEDNPTPVTGPLRFMTTQIISPASGSRFPVRQPITVQVTVRDPDGPGVTRVELIANNISVDQKPSINPQGDKELTVNLTWNAPIAPGNVNLTVIPYRGSTPGTQASVQVTVVDTAATATTSGGGGQTGGTAIAPTYNPVCRAKVDVDRLNFRSAPNTSASLFGYFVIGDEPRILSRLADNSWYKVQAITSAQVGWIYGPYTTVLGNCSAVPIERFDTPVPTATPTLAPLASPSRPDIVALPPSGLTTLQAGLDGSASATYTFTLQNIGGQPTGNFQVIISLSDGTQRSESIPSLQPGSIYTFPAGGLTVVFNAPGQHRIFYEADAGKVIDETNEGNNIAFIDVQVVSQ